MSEIEDLKRQIAQLDELMRSGVLTTEAARSKRDQLEAELLTRVTRASGAAEPSAQAAGPTMINGEPTRKMLLAIAACVLLIAGAGYAWLGNPVGLKVSPAGGAAATQAQGDAGHTMGAEQIEALIERLAQRLKESPGDAEGWLMLGRSYSVLGRHAEALPMYRKVVELRPDDAQGYADLADAVGVSQGSKLDGEPENLIAKALKLDPKNGKALSLAGTLSFNRGDMPTAVKQWELALTGFDPNGEMAMQLRGALAEARQRAGLPAQPTAAPTAEATAPGKGSAIQGRVTLAPELQSKVSPDDTVFIFARPAEGGKAPLAILRKQVKDLPFDFTLDDSQAMSPAMSLSTVKQAQVGARVSKSGNAMPQPGDLQGFTASVAVGAKNVQIVINEMIK